MDDSCMVFEMHLAFQNHPSTRIAIGTWYSLACFEMVESAPIGVSLEGVFARVNLFFVLPGEITHQAEETLPAFAL